MTKEQEIQYFKDRLVNSISPLPNWWQRIILVLVLGIVISIYCYVVGSVILECIQELVGMFQYNN